MKIRLIFLVVIAFSFLAIQCINAQSSNIIDLEVGQFSLFQNQEAYHLIDVRTPNEFNEGTIKGARNLDYFSPSFKTEIGKLDKAVPVYVFCRSGGRSSKAAKILIDNGFTKVYNLKGGFLAWKNKKK